MFLYMKYAHSSSHPKSARLHNVFLPAFEIFQRGSRYLSRTTGAWKHYFSNELRNMPSQLCSSHPIKEGNCVGFVHKLVSPVHSLFMSSQWE